MLVPDPGSTQELLRRAAELVRVFVLVLLAAVLEVVLRAWLIPRLLLLDCACGALVMRSVLMLLGRLAIESRTDAVRRSTSARVSKDRMTPGTGELELRAWSCNCRGSEQESR